MLSFYGYLTEAQEINLSKKAFNTLSHTARDMIESWEASNWVDGPLERAFKANNEVAQEILEAFKPVREYLQKKHGSSIKLYRGMYRANVNYSEQRILTSWTSDKRVAEHFAGLRRADKKWTSTLQEPITDADIKKAVDQYNKTGFVSFRGKKYKRTSDPQYYDIYDKSRQQITDGDNLERDLKSDQDWINQINKSKLDKAVVIEKNISISKIIWLTNNLNSKEYLVLS
jgi:hypothetical protein